MKRKFSRIRQVESDDDLVPAKKRPRPIEYNSSQETIIIDPDPEPQTNGNPEPQPQMNGHMKPQTSQETFSPPAPVSTVSMGSIKDYKAARVMNKMTGNVHQLYEDDADTFKPAKGTKAPQNNAH